MKTLPLKSITGPTPDPRGFAPHSAGFADDAELRVSESHWSYDDKLARKLARFKRLQAEFAWLSE